MKLNEAIEHANILEAKRALEDAVSLMARGKRTQAKRIELLKQANGAICRQLNTYVIEPEKTDHETKA